MTAIAGSSSGAPKSIQGVLLPDEGAWKKAFEPFLFDIEGGRNFLKLAYQFIKEKRNPNLTFPSIWINESIYHNVTCFHVVYLYWKHPAMQWDPEMDRCFEDLIDQMLNDKRLDLRATFTEDSLGGYEHFVDRSKNTSCDSEGFSLERATIAHYAAAIGDYSMVDKVLQRAPELIHMTCGIVQGKALLGGDCVIVDGEIPKKLGLEPNVDGTYRLKELQEIDVGGSLALASREAHDGVLYPVHRTVKVTILHLGARMGDEMVCSFLMGKGAHNGMPDSNGQTPSNYLQVSLTEGFVKRVGTTARLVSALQKVRLQNPLLPQVMCELQRETYTVFYDTKTKVAAYAYEKLTKESLTKFASRDGSTFKVDQDVPKENRAQTTYYTNSGWDRGHLAPAADAVASDKAMEDTFLLTNICPQDPKLNRTYWKAFERDIRLLTQKFLLVEVFTGGVFVPQQGQDGKMKVTYEVIGANGIAVPTHFFKVIYYNGTASNNAFLIPNREIPANTPITDFQVTVDKIQSLSGILFKQWRS